MESIAFPNCACKRSKTGSPKPTGTFFITQEITPPMVSPSLRMALILEIICAATSESGQRTSFVSALAKSKSL